MYGWDCFDAIPIDWHLTAVFPTCEEEGEDPVCEVTWTCCP
jgi:hypothetical protein